MHGGMHEKNAHKNGPSRKTARQGRAEQNPQPDLCKIYEILTIFMAKKLCLWYTVSDKRTAPLFLRAASCCLEKGKRS